MAGQGNSLIIGEVMIGTQVMQEYRDLLRPFDLHLVGLLAPLDVLEARERACGDREAGLARWQFGRVHRDIAYDWEVDTAAAAPAECARLIRDAFGL